MRISDWSSDVCSSDLLPTVETVQRGVRARASRLRGRGQRPGPDRVCHPGHALDARPALQLPQCRILRRHAGADQGRVRRPWYRGHHGEWRSEEHTSELQSLMRISYAVFCLKKKKTINKQIK